MRRASQAESIPLRDPAFSANKALSLHRWVDWIAGFSAEFVASAIERYLPDAAPEQATVLDPFAGVGTTNVEALRRGLHTVGFELNPFAALAARCKLEAVRLEPDRLQAEIERYAAVMAPQEEAIDNWWGASGSAGQPSFGTLPRSPAPEHFRTREPFFSPPVELKVRFTLDFIQTIEHEPLREYFRLALGATLVSCSNYSYEPSLCSRRLLGKPPVGNASVATAIVARLTQLRDDAVELRRELGRLGAQPRAAIVPGSFFDAPDHLAPGAVDLVVTSPPYLNNYHYVRNTRPQLYWLGFVQRPADLRRFETESFGRYWQTVRNGAPIRLAFRLPSLEALLEELRALRPERGIYGGTGWANYAAAYFNDSYRLFALLRTVLKRGGHAVVVVGNSLLQGVEFRVDEILAEIAALQGFDAAVERIRSKRVGDSIVGTGLRQKPQNGRPELYEAAVVVAA